MPMVASWHQGWQAGRNLPLRARHLLMQHQASAREFGQREPLSSLGLQVLGCKSPMAAASWRVC